MDTPVPIPKLIKSFMDGFVTKKNDIPPVSEKPTFTLCKPLMDAFDKNLINMEDDRDPIYGKLHLVSNTSQLLNGPALQVVASTNQGRLVAFIPIDTVRQRHNYVTRHHKNQLIWIKDGNTEEACKKLIISVIDSVYLEPLWEPSFKYKGKTLRDFLDLLIDDFQAIPVEQSVVKALIEHAWDPNKHIVKLFFRLKKHLTILGEMKNVTPYPEEDFAEALYMAVQKTKQFAKVCTKWKKKPTGNRATEAQTRAYFKDAYKIYDEERDSFHEVGVANNVVMQEKLDKLTAENVQMKLIIADNQAKNEKYHAVIETAISMLRAPIEETDNMTLQTQQWSSFTASQDKLYCSQV